MNSILFAESTQEIDSAINNGLVNNDLIIIALSIKVQAYLKSKSINYINTVPYFDNDAHERCLIHSKNVIETIENNFQYNIYGDSFFAVTDWLANGVRHAASNYITFLIEVITKAIDYHNPDKINIIKFDNYHKEGFSIFLGIIGIFSHLFSVVILFSFKFFDY